MKWKNDWLILIIDELKSSGNKAGRKVGGKSGRVKEAEPMDAILGLAKKYLGHDESDPTLDLMANMASAYMKSAQKKSGGGKGGEGINLESMMRMASMLSSKDRFFGTFSDFWIFFRESFLVVWRWLFWNWDSCRRGRWETEESSGCGVLAHGQFRNGCGSAAANGLVTDWSNSRRFRQEGLHFWPLAYHWPHRRIFRKFHQRRLVIDSTMLAQILFDIFEILVCRDLNPDLDLDLDWDLP